MASNRHDEQFSKLLAFHRRTERHLAELVGLAAYGACLRADPSSAAIAATLLRAFDQEFRVRHLEEERDLWPAIERAHTADVHRTAFRALRRRLAEQHRELEQAWLGMRKPLHAIADGLSRPVDALDAGYFRLLCTAHIHEEEMALQGVLALGLHERHRHETVMELKRA